MVNQEVLHWELKVDHGQATLVNIRNQYQATTILNLALALICQRAQQGQSHKKLEMIMLCHWIYRNHLVLHHLVSGKCQIHHRTITSQRLPVTMLLEMMIFPIIHKSYHHWEQINMNVRVNICVNLSLFSLLLAV